VPYLVRVFLRRHGKILLLRRTGNVYASGQLCLPSGHHEARASGTIGRDGWTVDE
jgi:hypothetical protein